MTGKTVHIENIGEVILERSVRARRIRLTVRRTGRVRVAVPRGISFELAVKFARSKAEWIRSQQKALLHSDRLADALCRIPLDHRMVRAQLLRRLAELAGEHGFSYGRVFIRNQKTRWGSCSRRNNINLNINLTRLPAELRDYVLLHELVHTRIKNHGPDFWRELDRLIPDCREMDRCLDAYRGLLGRV